jgi:hypothetical protein
MRKGREEGFGGIGGEEGWGEGGGPVGWRGGWPGEASGLMGKG